MNLYVSVGVDRIRATGILKEPDLLNFRWYKQNSTFFFKKNNGTDKRLLINYVTHVKDIENMLMYTL